MQTLIKLLSLLTPYERKRAGLLLVMMIIMALLDMIGVASILPFISVLTNPAIVETNVILNKMFEISNIFGVENNQDFLFALGIMVFIILITSLMFKALTTYAQLRFVLIRGYSISKRLVQGYLHQPYSWFLNQNSNDLGKNILSEVDQVIGAGMHPFMNLISQTLVTIAIVILIIMSDPKLALMISFTLGGAYGLFFYFIRRYLNQLGKKRLKYNLMRYKLVGEAFGATKEIKVGGLEKIYIHNFSYAARNTALTQASASAINLMPRFFLEAIAFGSILLIILYIMAQTGNLNNSLPIITLYVFAGYRLMPAVQQIYASLANLTFVGPALDNLIKDIENFKPIDENHDQKILSFNKTITLKNIVYNYPNASRKALKDINLNISAKSTVGLIGKTGSGKTTTVDIILGLLEPQKGTLEIDGQVITKKNLRSWQRSIGYVPQHIFLSDDTVEANIAFGVEPKEINQESIVKASKISNLHEFVIDELPKQYQTKIGERGIRLSGGQRQRIGIARALYHNPQVLILDEATSALDNQTEKVVMDAINNLSEDITIILIAHRLGTVKKCDKIFLLENGQIKNEGTFEELLNINENLGISIDDQ
jgi:ABC-type multidrug transport system fused ATPase/permease subunit